MERKFPRADRECHEHIKIDFAYSYLLESKPYRQCNAIVTHVLKNSSISTSNKDESQRYV